MSARRFIFLCVFFCAICAFITSAKAASDCSAAKAISVARVEPAVVTFCASVVNGVNHGCDFKAAKRPDLMKYDAGLYWLVTVNLIHSFDEKGQPRFMPEGAAFTHVSKACEVTEVMVPSARYLKKPEVVK